MPRNLVGERYLRASIPVVDGHLKRPAMHINYLELSAIFIVVRSFIRSYDVWLIKVLCDNSTAIT